MSEMGIAIGPNPLHLDPALSLCFGRNCLTLTPKNSFLYSHLSVNSPFVPGRNEHRRKANLRLITYAAAVTCGNARSGGNDDRVVQGLSPLFNVARPPFWVSKPTSRFCLISSGYHSVCADGGSGTLAFFGTILLPLPSLSLRTFPSFLRRTLAFLSSSKLRCAIAFVRCSHLAPCHLTRLTWPGLGSLLQLMCRVFHTTQKWKITQLC